MRLEPLAFLTEGRGCRCFHTFGSLPVELCLQIRHLHTLLLTPPPLRSLLSHTSRHVWLGCSGHTGYLRDRLHRASIQCNVRLLLLLLIPLLILPTRSLYGVTITQT
jgi:hypothetical protein